MNKLIKILNDTGVETHIYLNGHGSMSIRFDKGDDRAIQYFVIDKLLSCELPSEDLFIEELKKFLKINFKNS